MTSVNLLNQNNNDTKWLTDRKIDSNRYLLGRLRKIITLCKPQRYSPDRNNIFLSKKVFTNLL